MMWKNFFGNQQCKNGAACRNIANGRCIYGHPITQEEARAQLAEQARMGQQMGYTGPKGWGKDKGGKDKGAPMFDPSVGKGGKSPYGMKGAFDGKGAPYGGKSAPYDPMV